MFRALVGSVEGKAALKRFADRGHAFKASTAVAGKKTLQPAVDISLFELDVPEATAARSAEGKQRCRPPPPPRESSDEGGVSGVADSIGVGSRTAGKAAS
jgi:hypothetical protein